MSDHPKDPEEWDFKRARTKKHIEQCNTGYYKSTAHDVIEIHHLLCVHACSDKTLPEDLTEAQQTFITACMAATKWDIDEKENTIGLPLKWAYIRDRPSKGRPGWDNLPCHQVDHDNYLTSVMNYVTNQIWKDLLKGKELEKCKKMKGENLAAKLTAGSNRWRTHLEDRGSGSESGGVSTYDVIEYFENFKTKADKYGPATKPDPNMEANWYIPFSMAEPGDIRARAPLPRSKAIARSGLLGRIK